MLALAVEHIVYLNVRVVNRHTGHFLEREAVQTVCHGEDALSHILDREIRAHVVFVEVELLLFHLFSVVIIVPRSDFEITAVVVDISLHVGDFLMRLLDSRFPNLHQQTLGGFHRLCHDIVGLIVGIGLESEQVGFLLAQAQDCCNQRLVVVLVAIVCKVDVALIHLLAQRAVVGVCQERQTARSAQREHPLALQSGSLRLLGSLRDARSRQTSEVSLVVDHHPPIVCVVYNVVSKFQVSRSQLLVDVLQLSLLLRRQQRAATHHLLVVFLEQTFLRFCKVEFLAVVIHLLHAAEQTLVHHHLIVVFRQHGQNLLSKSLQLRC